MLALCIVFFHVILLNECKILDGYEFRVYSAVFCPRNENEMEQRSSAISCSKSDYYMCIPDEKFMNLLEFCYVESAFPVPNGVCCFLSKRASRVDTYKCTNFKQGCPNDTYYSNKIYEKPSCLSIENGCFAADQSCTGLNSISTQSSSTMPDNETTKSTISQEKKEKSDSGISTFLKARDMAEIYTILLYTMIALVPLSALAAIVLIVNCRKKKDKMKLGNGTSEDIPTHRNNESQTDRTISNNAKGSSSFEIDTEDNPTESRADMENLQKQISALLRRIRLRPRTNNARYHFSYIEEEIDSTKSETGTMKSKIRTHDTTHTNSHEEDDLGLLKMACQQEVEEGEHLLPDKSNASEIAFCITERKGQSMFNAPLSGKRIVAR